MKPALHSLSIILLLSGLTSCGDLDSFIESEQPILPRLPADDCGEFLMNAGEVVGMRWSSSGEEIYFDTWNSINAIRLGDKSTRTIVGMLSSPRTVSVTGDDQQLYFTAMDQQWETGLYVVSTSGGAPTLLAQRVAGIFFSSDHQTAVYNAAGSAYAVDLRTRVSRLLHSGEALALSDDGTSAVVRYYPPPNYSEECYIVSTTSASSRRISLSSWNVWKYKWIGGDLIAYIVQYGSAAVELLTWRASTGEYSSPISLGLQIGWESMDLSRNGDRIVWWIALCASQNARGDCDFQELSLHGTQLASPKDTTLARAYTRSYYSGARVALSNDGKKVAIVVKSGLYCKEVM